MVFDRDACVCRCKDSFAVLKRDCLTRPIGGEIVNYWDDDTCTCKCKPRVCVEGHYQDRTSCECKPVESTCSAIGGAAGIANLNTDDHDHHTAPKYIGLGCVILVTLAMVLSLYYMLMKRKSNDHRTLVGPSYAYANETARFRGCSLAAGLSGLASNIQDGTATIGSVTSNNPGAGHSTAYTITINSQSSTNLDEAVLPLTEDKTRF